MKPFILLAFLAIGAGAFSFSGQTSWNSIMNAKNILPITLDTIQGTATPSLSQLKAILDNPATLSQAYMNYMANQNKTTATHEIIHREQIFKENLLRFAAHNLEARMGLKSWEMGVSIMTDLTDDEIVARYTGARREDIENSEFYKQLPTDMPTGAPRQLRTDMPTGAPRQYPTGRSLGQDPTSQSLGGQYPTGRSLGQDPTSRSLGQDPTSQSLGQDPTSRSLGQDPTSQSLGGQYPTGRSLGQDPTSRSLGQDPTSQSLGQYPTGRSLGQDPTSQSLNQGPTGQSLGQYPTGRSLGQDPTSQSLQAPAARDWRDYGIVTPPKMQGTCGSCYSFAAAGVLESSHALWHQGAKTDLSEQQIVDCSGGKGCQGAWFDTTFNYIRDNGVTSEDEYKYEERQGSCRARGKSVVAKAKGWYKSASTNEEDMKNKLGDYGPIYVQLYFKSLSHYHSGIFEGPCEKDGYHAVSCIGYGNEGGKDFWLCKNSWDTNWGDGGYFKVRRNFGNLCGIADYGIFVTA